MDMNENRFFGIAVSDLVNQTHSLVIDNCSIFVHQVVSSPTPHCKLLEFKFEMPSPARFRIDVLLPEEIVNACVTLNAQVLIGLFSSIVPADCDVPKQELCNGAHEEGHQKISTLVPGKFQSINFRWMSTDVLKFHLFYA